MPNQDISLTNYDPDLARIQRQQQYAQMLQEQSMEPIQAGPGGFGAQAPISPLSVLAKALQAYSARKYSEQGDTQLADLQTQRRQGLADMLSKQYQVPAQAAQGVNAPNIGPGATGYDTTQGAISDATASRPTTPQEQMANSLSMMSSSNPQAAQMAPQLYQSALQKQQISDIAGNTPPPGVAPTAWKAALLSGDADKISALSQQGQQQLQVQADKDRSFNQLSADQKLNLELKGREVGLSGQRLFLEQKRMAADNLAAPTQIGYTGPNGEEVQTAASWDKKGSHYVDAATGKPITNPQNLRIIGNATGGGRSMAMAGRVSTAALDAASDIENMAAIGPGGTMGLLGVMGNTPVSALGRSLTSQQVQDMQTTMAGLSRAMSLLGSGGMQGSESIMKSFDSLQPQEGNSQLTMMRKLGSFRQQAVNGIDSALASPMYSPTQKKQLEVAKQKITNAVPWLPSDVQRLENSGDSNASMHDIFSKKLGKGASPYAHLTDAQIKAQLGIP